MNKSPNSNGASQPQPSDELRQQLWELSYDLLDDESAAELRARIKSDPALARLYAEVRLQADLVAAASRVEDLGFSLAAGPESTAEPAVTVSRGRGRGSHYRSRETSHESSRQRPTGAREASVWTNWLAIGGTVALLVLLTIGLNQPRAALDSIAKVDDYVFTSFAIPAEITEGLTQPMELEARSIDGSGVKTELEYRVVDGEGRETYRKQVTTAADGRAHVSLPGDLLKPGSKVEVRPAADNGEHDRSVSAPLNVAPETSQTVVLLEKPFAKPGEKVGFSITRVKPFSKKTELPPTDDLMLESQSGDLVQPMWTSDPDVGVVNGQFELPRVEKLKELAFRLRSESQSDAKQQKSNLREQRQGAALAERRSSNGGRNSNGTLADVEKFYLDAYREPVEQLQRESAPTTRSLAMGSAGQLAQAQSPQEKASGFAGGQGGPGGINPSRINPSNIDPRPTAPSAPVPAPPTPAPANAPAGPSEPKPAEGQADANPLVRGGKTVAGDPGAGNQRAGQGGAGQGGSGQPVGGAPKGTVRPMLEGAGGGGFGAEAKKEAENAAKRMEAPKPQALAANAVPADDASPGAPATSPPAPRGMPTPSKPGAMAGPGASTMPAPTIAATPEPSLAKETAQMSRASGLLGGELRKASEPSISEQPTPQELKDLAGIAVVKQGSTVVARRRVASADEAERAKQDLPPEASGVLTYEFFPEDGRGTPAYREQFLHETGRQLQIALEGLKDHYRPGETVQLKLRVQDELARTVPAAVGVRVWSEQAVRTTRAPLSLAAALNRNSFPKDSFQNEEQLASLEAATAAAPIAAQPVEAAVADAPQAEPVPLAKAEVEELPALRKQKLDALQGSEAPAPPAIVEAGSNRSEQANEERTPGVSNLAFGAAQPQELAEQGLVRNATPDSQDVRSSTWSISPMPDVLEADNRSQVQRDYDMAVAAERMQHNDRWQKFGRLLVWSAAGLLLVIGLMLIARQPIRMAVLVPAVGLSLVCLALGVTWFIPQESGGLQLAWNIEQPKSAQPTATSAMESATATSRETTPSTESEGVASDGSFEALGAVPAQAGGISENFAASPGEFAPVGPAASAAVDSVAGAKANDEANRAAGFKSPTAAANAAANGRRDLTRITAADKVADAEGEQAKKSAAVRGGQQEPQLAAGNAPAAVRGANLSGGAAFGGSAADGQSSPPDAIYWRPLSATDSEGVVTIEFTLPTIPADYVLLIDAIGSGRIGHVQQVIHSRASE